MVTPLTARADALAGVRAPAHAGAHADEAATDAVEVANAANANANANAAVDEDDDGGDAASEAVVACPDCDAVQTRPPARGGGRFLCFRCGAVLARGGVHRPERALAFTLAAIPLFIAANVLPLMRLEGRAGAAEATVLGAVSALFHQRLPLLAALVLLTTIALPALRLGSLVHLLLASRRRRVTEARRRARPGRRPRAFATAAALAVLRRTGAWAQTEILLLGALVAYAKLGGVFTMRPGMGLAATVGFLIVQQRAARAVDVNRLGQALARRQWRSR